MPGTPELSRRTANRYCIGEGHLELASSRSILFTFDIEYVRNKVASEAYSPEEGVEFMNEQEPISKLQEEQLFKCLSTIAIGNCEKYRLTQN